MLITDIKKLKFKKGEEFIDVDNHIKIKFDNMYVSEKLALYLKSK